MAKVFKRRWFMHDMARQRYFDKREFTAMLDLLERMEYNGIGLYLEGAMEFKSIDGVIHKGVITYSDAKWIADECKKRGMFVFPMTNVVGHMEHFFTQERYRSLKMDMMTQMNFRDPRAESFAMQIVHEYNDAFGSGMVHIGGDEVRLPPELKTEYAAFLSKICDSLLAEGIQPGIWNDMLWMSPELCEPFDRNVFIFDWNYHGHRPESIKLFKEAGFKNFIACPSDNSYRTLITYQNTRDFLKARTDISVRPDEIEAFLADEAECDILGEPSAMITNWENSHGRNNWCQWSAFARAGLFMTGKLGEGERNDALIERTLFGRVTPYTEIVYMLQDVIKKYKMDYIDSADAWSPRLRDCLFRPRDLKAVLLAAIDEPEFTEEFCTVLDNIDEKLCGWQPRDDIELFCHTSMKALSAMLRAGTELVLAFGGCKRYYSRAAELQFSEPSYGAELLCGFTQGIRGALVSAVNARNAHAEALKLAAIEDKDIARMDIIIGLISEICDETEAGLRYFDTIPLTLLEKIIIGVIDSTPHEGKL